VQLQLILFIPLLATVSRFEHVSILRVTFVHLSMHFVHNIKFCIDHIFSIVRALFLYLVHVSAFTHKVYLYCF